MRVITSYSIHYTKLYEAVVAEVAEVARDAYSAVAAEYRGLTVGEITSLRIKARQENVYLRVVKNTLARRALQDTRNNFV